ncbi:MAG: aquaporin [Armatimonadetes bacterium]|nr:aquaporin [Armatimonadota bacterium]
MIKRYLAEFIGTFVIVFAPVFVASADLVNGRHSTELTVALVSGMPVLAMIAALGPISAAHFNPAVTLGFAVARRVPWRFVIPYWLSQLGGASVAATAAFLVFGKVGGAQATTLDAQLQGCVVEALITFVLMLTIIAVATDKRTPGGVPPLAIGMAVVVGVLIGLPVTGGSMNPARAFGPALYNQGAFATLWVYLVGPGLGAGAAALIYEAVRLEPEHAKGAPDLDERV